MSYASGGSYGNMGRGGGGGAFGLPGGYVPAAANLKNFQVNLDNWEVIRQSLYDSAAYAANGVTSLAFFLNPVGQGTGFGGGAKTLSDTNMTLAGQIPSSQMFLIQEVEVQFQPTTPTVVAQMPAVFGAQAAAQLANDTYIFYRSGNLALTIGSKSYLQEAPLMSFPPTSVFEVQGALSDATTAGSAFQSRLAFAGARGIPYVLAPSNLMLKSNQNFQVNLAWPEGLQAITNPARVFVKLNGFLYRQAQ